LERSGARVRLAAVDAADEGAMARLFDEAEARGAAVRGVLHAAGVTRPAPLAEATQGELDEVLRAKVDGVLAIERAAAGRPLDFLVLFSSAAGVLGAARLGAYAAANQYLDAVAARRLAEGLPCTSVAWGRWPTGGITTAEGERYADEIGLEVLDSEASFELLGRLLAAGTPPLLACDVRWERFAGVVQARRRQPLLAEVEPEPADAGDAPSTAWVQRLRRTPAAERFDALCADLRRRLAEVLGGEDAPIPPERGFFELGMSSVSALELKTGLARDLGRPLPATLAFEHPTVERLARHLLEEVLQLGGTESADGTGSGGATDANGSAEHVLWPAPRPGAEQEPGGDSLADELAAGLDRLRDRVRP
ncbi:MAG: beta-ketoacyl reductase, partial [Planctomycetota bacterium]